MLKKLQYILFAIILSISLCSCSILKNSTLPSETSSNIPASAVPTETVRNTSPMTSDADTTEDEPVITYPPIPTPEPGAPKTILIDAGHGYSDPGCTAEYLNGQYEREIVADSAQQLSDILEAAGYRTIMLRDDSKYITAAEIADAADRLGVDYLPDKLVDDNRFAAYNRTVWANILLREQYIDMLISFHIDVYEDSEDVHGTRLYYCSENDFSKLSESLCGAITARLSDTMPYMNPRYFAKGWEDAFVVTKRSEMPSVLIEMGFATNKEDAAHIIDREWRGSFVSAVADGIGDYFDRLS